MEQDLTGDRVVRHNIVPRRNGAIGRASADHNGRATNAPIFLIIDCDNIVDGIVVDPPVTAAPVGDSLETVFEAAVVEPSHH